MDYQIEFVFRDLTEDEAEKKAGEIHDFLFMSDPNSEFEQFVMRIHLDDDGDSFRLEHVSHWPEDATGPFNDRVWEGGDD
jgi:hypothetical protein